MPSSDEARRGVQPARDASRVVTVTLELPVHALRLENPQPSHISQLNCALIGFDGKNGRRTFVETVKRYSLGGGPVAKVGRLRLVERDPFLAWLFRVEQPAPDAEDSDAGVRALAAELGLRLVDEPPRRRDARR
jgi:hypothetical protein